MDEDKDRESGYCGADSAWIETYTSRKFHLLAPRGEEICVQDIAHALSFQCRFTGHTRQFYCVAEHCIRVSRCVPETDAAAGLLHDAAEAYMGDLSRPLKRGTAIQTVWLEIEERIAAAIAGKFGLPWPMPETVKLADLKLLLTEKRDLMSGVPWSGTAKADSEVQDTAPLPGRIVPMVSEYAEQYFLKTFSVLGLKCCCR